MDIVEYLLRLKVDVNAWDEVLSAFSNIFCMNTQAYSEICVIQNHGRCLALLLCVINERLRLPDPHADIQVFKSSG